MKLKGVREVGFYSEIELPSHGGGDGLLVALEQNSECVPFLMKRIYYIFDVKDTLRRGFHAHKKLKQLIVCVRGQCDLMLDNGRERTTIRMDSPVNGVLIEEPLWREMFNFSEDCVLLVLASEVYKISDYIRDYKEFQRFAEKTKNV